MDNLTFPHSFPHKKVRCYIEKIEFSTIFVCLLLFFKSLSINIKIEINEKGGHYTVNIFMELPNMIADLGDALVSSFSQVSAIFYDPTPTTGGITLVGYLLIATLAVGFIKLALNLVVRLFTRIK